MPIYRRTYREYEGSVKHAFRWAIVAEQEWRVFVRTRIFMFLMLVALLHCLFRFMQVLAYDVVMQDPNNPLTPVLSQLQMITVNERMLLDFVSIQGPIVLILTLYAGAGMICNDARNNLMEVYFSKPIRWYDYALGKLLALVTLGLSVTALPAVILVVLHNLLAPSMELLAKSWWWAPAAVAFSLIMTLSCSLAVLASSALLRSQNYAAVALFVVLIADSAMASLLAHMLHRPPLFLLSFPLSLNRVGQSFFGDTRLLYGTSITWPAAYVAALCLVAGLIVFRHARRAEVAQ